MASKSPQLSLRATKKTKAKPVVRPCKCSELINEKLSEFNTQLVPRFSISFPSGKAHTLIELATEKIDPRIRKAKKSVVASYCPFCGKKMP